MEGIIPLPVRYSYLSILPDEMLYFAASPLILYCSFPSLILLPIAMIRFYISFKRFFMKCKGLFDAKVISITKKEYGFCSTLSAKIHEVFKVSI